ncbi:MAG: bifunctional phosphoglucose/phosphomannose isomerase [Thermofilum sp.]
MRIEELLALYASHAAVDSQEMLARALSLPADIRDGSERYSTLVDKLPLPRDPESVIVAGMGGSFIGGLFLQDALYEESSKMIIPLRETGLPGSVNERHLLVAVSYSGNTEETLRVVLEARRRRIPTVAVTSGGLLAKLATEWKIPLVEVPSGLKPRAAFPYMCTALAAVVEAAGLVDGLMLKLKEAAGFLENVKQEVLDAGNSLARWLFEQYEAGNFPVVYSYRPFLSAGYRLKTQINENAKLHAFFSEIPEANHNEIMGWEGPFRFSAVIVRAPGEPPYVHHRMEFLRELLRGRGVKHVEVHAIGENQLQKLLSLFYAFDIASILLALLRGTDPAPTATIDSLKKYLEERIDISREI